MASIWPIGKRLSFGKNKDIVMTDGKTYSMRRFQVQEAINASTGRVSMHMGFHLFGHVFRVDIPRSDSWFYRKAVEIIDNAKN